jgi:hypothetical protein
VEEGEGRVRPGSFTVADRGGMLAKQPYPRALAREAHARPEAQRAGVGLRGGCSSAAARPAAAIADRLALRDRLGHERFTIRTGCHDSTDLYTRDSSPNGNASSGGV